MRANGSLDQVVSALNSLLGVVSGGGFYRGRFRFSL
jgi:hypothetical protein